MNKEQIFELKELALHEGLFVEGPVYEDGVLVSFLDEIYIGETFIARLGNRCPECGSLLLEISDEFKEQYNYDHVCSNLECKYNCPNVPYDDHTAEEESTLGIVLSAQDKILYGYRKFIKKLMHLLKKEDN